jgi:hypothetical protein
MVCLELPALTANSPRLDRLRWPTDLVAGWTGIARSQCAVKDKRRERSSASRMEFPASESRSCRRVGGGFCTPIEPWSRADNR